MRRIVAIRCSSNLKSEGRVSCTTNLITSSDDYLEEEKRKEAVYLRGEQRREAVAKVQQ